MHVVNLNNPEARPVPVPALINNRRITAAQSQMINSVALARYTLADAGLLKLEVAR